MAKAIKSDFDTFFTKEGLRLGSVIKWHGNYYMVTPDPKGHACSKCALRAKDCFGMSGQALDPGCHLFGFYFKEVKMSWLGRMIQKFKRY